jgi:uncharacterized protein YndB with AHSA1/START domain
MSCVTREITLPIDRDDAWEELSDLEGWLAEEAELDLRPGGDGHFRFADGSERRAVVEEVDEGERLTWWWFSDDPEDLGTRVELRLEDAVAGTRVIVVESGYAPGPVATAVTGWLRLPLGLTPSL